MKIYVSHSTSFSYKKELYEPLRANFPDLNIFLPHEKSNEIIDTKQIITTADLLLAEVSYPSTGQGIELGWANDFSVPIICIYRNDAEPSEAVRIVSNEFISYLSSDELVDKLRRVLFN